MTNVYFTPSLVIFAKLLCTCTKVKISFSRLSSDFTIIQCSRTFSKKIISSLAIRDEAHCPPLHRKKQFVKRIALSWSNTENRFKQILITAKSEIQLSTSCLFLTAKVVFPSFTELNQHSIYFRWLHCSNCYLAEHLFFFILPD